MDDSAPDQEARPPVTQPPRIESHPVPRWKRWLFRCLALLLSSVLLLVLEVPLWLMGVGVDLRLLVPVRDAALSGTVAFNPQADRAYHGAGDLAGPEPRPAWCPKPIDTYRIVFVGGSTVAGYPYDPAITFPRRVEAMLNAQASHEPHFEVLNAGMAAIDSLCIASLTKQLIDLDPDLIVIHAGHNEFVGPGAPSTRLGAFPTSFASTLFALRHWRLVQAMGGVHSGSSVSAARKASFPMASLNPKDLPVVTDHFRSNLRRTIATGRAHDIAVVVSSVASNLKDQGPLAGTAATRSPPDLPQEARQPASLAFRRAQKALREGDVGAAREGFALARDRDPFPIRAPGSLAQVAEEVASEFDSSVSFLNISQVVDRAATEGIPGKDLFLDHVHYNVPGHHVVATAFARHVWESVLENDWRIDRVLSEDELSASLGVTPEDEIAAQVLVREALNGPPLSQALDTELRRQELDESIQELRNDLDARRLSVLRRFHSQEISQLPEILSEAHRAAGNGDLANDFARRARSRRPWSLISERLR